MTKPVHLLFPTLEKAEANKQSVYSDHLTILVEIPLTEEENLRIVSMNVLGPSGGSGLHRQSGWETDDDAKARYKRIAEGLALGVQKQGADVVYLQETHNAFMLDPLMELLGKDWEVAKGEGSSGGMLTCYHKTRLHPKSDATFDPANKVISLTVNDTVSGKTILLHNVWSLFSPYPVHTEGHYDKLLRERTEDIAVSVVAGDTNSRIAPLDDSPRNIATGIVPTGFNSDYDLDRNVQIADFPDGGFYRTENEQTQQALTHVLDLTTGEIFIDTTPKDELAVWPKYRMVMCLDDSLSQRKVMDGKTLSEYEDLLKAALPDDPGILVRMAANSFNEKAIAIRFSTEHSKDLYDAVKNALASDDSFQFQFEPDTDSFTYYTISAPLNDEKLKLFHQILFGLISVPDLDVPRPHHPKKIMGILVGIGFILGVGLGIALVATGIFSPFGVGILGAVALAATTGGGLGLLFGAIGFGATKAIQATHSLSQDPEETEISASSGIQAVARLGESVVAPSKAIETEPFIDTKKSKRKASSPSENQSDLSDPRPGR